MQLTRAPAPETWGWVSAPEGPRMRASGDGGRRPFRANPSAAGPWASRWHGVVIPDLCPEHSGQHQREPGSLGRKRLHHEAKQGALRPASACYSRTIVFELQVMFQHVGARVGTGCRSGAETKHVDLLRLPIFPEAVRQRPRKKQNRTKGQWRPSRPRRGLVTGLPLQVLLTAQLSPHVDSPPVIPDY
ncbi:hypothetical protein Purlil1_6422 [Purpureocillium lilacinum]|uniref:Uncharacterized protein n=1 Tax=Purpureocillium lilacinum TaxID=33203 RepID=A0ABR0C130_PURLI|nr:hypothetical protein Purlil1_6422 [Purpureocillium lilacinum]